MGLQEQPEYSEVELETVLLNHIQEFLLELGDGFCFEARQKRITVDDEHDRVDLVFYHRILKYHILIDLKVRKFSHADAGQMNFYLNSFKENIMTTNDNDPVGLILCTSKTTTKVRYAISGMDNKLFVSKYLISLPSEKELEDFIVQDREFIPYIYLISFFSLPHNDLLVERIMNREQTTVNLLGLTQVALYKIKHNGFPKSLKPFLENAITTESKIELKPFNNKDENTITTLL